MYKFEHFFSFLQVPRSKIAFCLKHYFFDSTEDRGCGWPHLGQTRVRKMKRFHHQFPLRSRFDHWTVRAMHTLLTLAAACGARIENLTSVAGVSIDLLSIICDQFGSRLFRSVTLGSNNDTPGPMSTYGVSRCRFLLH